MCKVSIIMAIYHANEEWMKRAINSCLKQTEQNIEIFLVCDGTTQDNIELCQEYANQDKRIKVFVKENEGLAATRNYGIQKATGEYIAFLDQDDWMELETIEQAYQIAKDGQADIVGWRFYAETSQGALENYYVGQPKMIFLQEDLWKLQATMLYTKYFPEMQISLFMTAWGKLISRTLLQQNPDIQFPIEVHKNDDLIFFLKLFEKTDKVVVVDKLWNHYWQNDGSMTKQYNKKDFININNEDLELLQSVIKTLKNQEKLDKAYYAHVRNTFILIMQLCVLDRNVFSTKKEQKKICRELLNKQVYKDSFQNYQEETNKKKRISYWFAKHKIVTMVWVITKIYRSKMVRSEK